MAGRGGRLPLGLGAQRELIDRGGGGSSSFSPGSDASPSGARGVDGCVLSVCSLLLQLLVPHSENGSSWPGFIPQGLVMTTKPLARVVSR